MSQAVRHHRLSVGHHKVPAHVCQRLHTNNVHMPFPFTISNWLVLDPDPALGPDQVSAACRDYSRQFLGRMKHRQEKKCLRHHQDPQPSPPAEPSPHSVSSRPLAPILPIAYQTPAPASPAKQAFGMPTNPRSHHAAAYPAILAHHDGYTTAGEDSPQRFGARVLGQIVADSLCIVGGPAVGRSS
ncbi:hypothetical protein PMIN06_003747 [Paraphaeosphaeria minitans]